MVDSQSKVRVKYLGILTSILYHLMVHYHNKIMGRII
jgi:hypothetical protein